MTAVISSQCTEQIVAMNHHTSQVKSILKKGKSLRRIKGIKKRIGKAKRAKGRTLVSEPVIAEPVHSCPSEGRNSMPYPCQKNKLSDKIWNTPTRTTSCTTGCAFALSSAYSVLCLTCCA